MIKEDPYIHGYELRDRESVFGDEETDDEDVDWDAEFTRLVGRLRVFLGSRDAYMALGKTAHQCIFENLLTHNRYPNVELAALEVLQALFLTSEQNSSQVPTSPRNFSKAWKDLKRLLKAFSKKQAALMTDENPAEQMRHRVKVQTMYYRFPFNEDVSREIIRDILERIDKSNGGKSSLADQYNLLLDVSELVSNRFQKFSENVGRLLNSKNAEEAHRAIEFICAKSSSASLLWSRCSKKPWSLEDLRVVGYQLAELATPAIFIIDREDIANRFGKEAIVLIEELSMHPGALRIGEFERYIMDNPVWRKPFIQGPDRNFMLAIQYFANSYPFKIAEVLIGSDQKRLNAYSKARSDYLEDAVAKIVAQAMPSATVYRNVLWDDPETGVRYENDTVATLGNFIFVFEAKSGKISPASRRGAEKSLNKNIRELFIEPREQSSRLQNYLNANRSDVKLWEKDGGKEVVLDLSKPKLAYSFSVCFEHFASISSSKHYFTSAGLFDSKKPWAPVFSLGELRMISDFLDSEVSFVHYLTRRYWVEAQMDFDGDEQDLLSMYLTNGFCLLGEFPKDKRLIFIDADDPVRTQTMPASERRSSRAKGIKLPPLWKNTVDEIYKSEIGTARHKFDIICTILNQSPPALLGLQKHIMRWRRGAGGAKKGPQYVNYTVASRQFVLAVQLLGKELFDEFELKNEARLMAYELANTFSGTTDVVVFVYRKKSKEITHDGVFFFRVGPDDVKAVI